LTVSQKEPKLSRARKIPEWEEYDGEIARFARKLAEDGLIRSRIVASDANLLANVGPSTNNDPAPESPIEESTPAEEEYQRDEL
jgi:UDP-glucose:glycoprotein glucosyltransferase